MKVLLLTELDGRMRVSTEKQPRIRHPAKNGDPLLRPLMLSTAPAGFPSPAEDHIDQNLDLNEHLIRRPAATFFVRVSGQSMVGAGINDGALLIVDRSEEVRDGRIVIAVVDGAHTVKRLRKKGDQLWLEAANPAYPDIRILDDESRIWGVVTYAINPL
jgi:DNA polymerase V